MPTSDQGELFSAEPPPPPGKPGGGAAMPESQEHQPLAVRMRPRKLSEVVGQDHILKSDSLLPRLVQNNRFGSLLFYGPPGCGKTSIAESIAAETNSRFVRVNAVMSNVAELRDILSVARRRPEDRTIVFIDEIHRFNKAQQDLLLPDVEAGNIRLIGATTHNPGFYVNPPLLSRSHLFRLEPLGMQVVADVLVEALADSDRGLGVRGHTSESKVMVDLAALSDGDLRRALNALEVIALSLDEGAVITEDDITIFAQERRIRYDADEDEHYDTISAFIKSVRGGDPDAAMYWLVKMLEGGEDPRFIARRLVILASEDVGLADPQALPIAIGAHHACDFVGLPECRYNLAHATIYLATAPKSNSATCALGAAEQAVREQPVQSVPLELRDKGGQASKRLEHGKGYRYSHDFPGGISGQDYLEKPLSIYVPKNAGAESGIVERLKKWGELKAKAQAKTRRKTQ